MEPRPDVLLFVFLAGLGCGAALSALCVWVACRFMGGTLPTAAQPLPGMTVRDSTMGEFDAVRRSV